MVDTVLDVQRTTVLDEPLDGRLRAMYLRAFGPLAARSIVRATATGEEWAHFASCPDLIKYVAFAADQPVGLLLVARRPDVIDWLEPATFAARWPGEDPWYIVSVAVEPDQHGSQAFRALLDAMLDDAGPRQVIVFDTCDYNTPQLARTLQKRADLRFGPSTVTVDALEVQRFLTASVVDGTLRAREIDREQFFVLHP